MEMMRRRQKSKLLDLMSSMIELLITKAESEGCMLIGFQKFTFLAGPQVQEQVATESLAECAKADEILKAGTN